MAKRETSTQTWYVYTGDAPIRTDDGIRTNINGDEDTAKPFVASVGWLRRHAPISHRLVTLEEHKANQEKAKANKPKPEPKPEPPKEVAKTEGAKPKPKRKAKAKKAESE